MTDEPAAPNDTQRRAWDGPAGDYWAAHADHYDRGVAGYRDAFLAAAAPGPDDRVLDVGCGNGLTSRDLARRAGSVLGVDLSAAMLDVARRRSAAEGLSNVGFRQADVQTGPLPSSFDVAVSRHGAMFFDDPSAAFAAIAGALRPGGRLVLLVWRTLGEQEWLPAFFRALRATPPGPDGPSPVSLGDPATVRALLTGAGFDDVVLTEVDRPMWFGADADEATRFVAGQFAGLVEANEPGERPRVLADLRAEMARRETPDGVLFASACWLVTATRSGPLC